MYSIVVSIFSADSEFLKYERFDSWDSLENFVHCFYIKYSQGFYFQLNKIIINN